MGMEMGMGMEMRMECNEIDDNVRNLRKVTDGDRVHCCLTHCLFYLCFGIYVLLLVLFDCNGC